MKLGALEAGGTKMVCAIGDETGKIYEQVSIATTTPEESIPKLIAYFQDQPPFLPDKDPCDRGIFLHNGLYPVL